MDPRGLAITYTWCVDFGLGLGDDVPPPARCWRSPFNLIPASSDYTLPHDPRTDRSISLCSRKNLHLAGFVWRFELLPQIFGLFQFFFIQELEQSVATGCFKQNQHDCVCRTIPRAGNSCLSRIYRSKIAEFLSTVVSAFPVYRKFYVKHFSRYAGMSSCPLERSSHYRGTTAQLQETVFGANSESNSGAGIR